MSAPEEDRAETSITVLRDYLPNQPAAPGGEHQCPHCGRFELSRTPPQEFECLSCGFVWSWCLGEAWPDTVARPEINNSEPKET